MTYKDRKWCAIADKCAVKDCDKRLSEQDKDIIKTKGSLVSWIDYSEIRKCFEPKQPSA